jgi:hypothetical protein
LETGGSAARKDLRPAERYAQTTFPKKKVYTPSADPDVVEIASLLWHMFDFP